MDVRTCAKGDWRMLRENLQRLTVAFQPIVSTTSGQIFAHEVLVRGYEALGHQSAGDLLRASHDAGLLPELEALVRLKALRALPPAASDGTRVLSFNLDHRIADAWNVLSSIGAGDPGRYGVRVVTEISSMPACTDAVARIRLLKRGGAMLALDRSFIQGIEADARKKVVLAQLIGMAHTLGVQVIAVGIENAPQLRICRDLGCDLVQGFFVQAPIADARHASPTFPHVALRDSFTDRRRKD